MIERERERDISEKGCKKYRDLEREKARKHEKCGSKKDEGQRKRGVREKNEE